MDRKALHRRGDEHVAAVLRRKEAMSLPRFEEKLEIRDRFREALAEHLQGVDLACGAVSGVPTHKEMQQHRGTSIPPHLDLVRAYKELRKLWRKVRRPKPRFFLYAAHSLDRVGWVLREGEMPATARVAAGASFELLAGFADREEGLAALRRLERGFGSLKRSHEDEPMPPWVTAACRPAAIR